MTGKDYNFSAVWKMQASSVYFYEVRGFILAVASLKVIFFLLATGRDELQLLAAYP